MFRQHAKLPLDVMLGQTEETVGTVSGLYTSSGYCRKIVRVPEEGF